jgi:hypothetical protein
VVMHSSSRDIHHFFDRKIYLHVLRGKEIPFEVHVLIMTYTCSSALPTIQSNFKQGHEIHTATTIISDAFVHYVLHLSSREAIRLSDID